MLAYRRLRCQSMLERADGHAVRLVGRLRETEFAGTLVGARTVGALLLWRGGSRQRTH